MKAIRFSIYVLTFSLFLINEMKAQNDSPPVQKLKELYTTNIEFQSTVDKMFKNVQDLADGSKNPWRGKGIQDLYTFLNEWFYFLPNKNNGLDRIIKFSLLYYQNPDGQKFILEEPGLSWSLFFIEERGKFMESPASTKNINEWLSDESLGNEDFVLPKDGFTSFNDFFTRDIKHGARPIDNVHDNSVIVSPADGVINVINNDLKLDTKIPTKAKMELSLNQLLDSSEYAQKFIGGTAIAVFLMPTNYHHYHAPVSGIMVESKESVGDRLFGMPNILDMINNGNPGYNKDYSVFQDFRHGYFIINTQDFGHVAMIPIGLQTIGSVNFVEKFRDVKPSTSKKVYKGEKLGYFAFGGSTVLLLFEKNRLTSLTVQQGQRIGKFTAKY
ncbi:phosphatidylserine decarboxylase [Aquimarina mytili]|uniref:Phosphatidylserine decarboxylase n=1 Tax=Aquimarina mytili TaxID=874423 RepID=A0A936ZQZ6_9FLAO|nr:phosphatidylserine decarboxylase [Aquimarina mytili]MBL0682687.1 phosphatidylserine decarboxylase [Aquimarina mytili]